MVAVQERLLGYEDLALVGVGGARRELGLREVAGGLAKAGVKRGDNISIIGDNRPNLYAAMMGVQMLGAVPVPRVTMMRT